MIQLKDTPTKVYAMGAELFLSKVPNAHRSASKLSIDPINSPQPLGNFLSFLEATIAFEGMGRPKGFRRFRKTHLENILPRGS